MGAVLKQKHIQPISSRPNSEIIFVKTRSMLTSASTRLLQAPKLATVEQLKEQKRKAVEVEDYELLGPPFWSVFYDFITCWRFLPGDSVYP